MKLKDLNLTEDVANLEKVWALATEISKLLSISPVVMCNLITGLLSGQIKDAFCAIIKRHK